MPYFADGNEDFVKTWLKIAALVAEGNVLGKTAASDGRLVRQIVPRRHESDGVMNGKEDVAATHEHGERDLKPVAEAVTAEGNNGREDESSGLHRDHRLDAEVLRDPAGNRIYFPTLEVCSVFQGEVAVVPGCQENETPDRRENDTLHTET